MEEAYIFRSEGYVAIGNRYLELQLGLDEERFSTVSITNKLLDKATRFQSSPEFTLYFEDKDGNPFSISNIDCELLSIEDSTFDQDGSQLSLNLKNDAHNLSISIHYRLTTPDFYLHKCLEIKNEGEEEILLLNIDVENLKLKSYVSRGGEGQPVFVEDQLFLGLEFPYSSNNYEHNNIRLTHFPGVTLKGGESYRSKSTVMGIRTEESLEDTFKRYVERIAVRRKVPCRIFGDWAAHDELSDNIHLTEELTLELLDHLEYLAERWGIKFDYYLMDAFWFDPAADYIKFDDRYWPEGFDCASKRIQELGLKLGLWFDTTGGVLENKALEHCKNHRGRFCLNTPEYEETLRKSFRYHIENHKLGMIKFDFAMFECNNEEHGHRTGKYSREKSVDVLMDILREAREENPELVVLAYNGFVEGWGIVTTIIEGDKFPISPWWLTFIDFLYAGDPRPSEIPSLSLRDSINYYQDHQARLFSRSLIPWYMTDDHGIMIGKTGTIYWLEGEGWREAFILSLSRGNLKPHFYGDLRLLDDSDREFLSAAMKLFNDNVECFSNTKAILGMPGKGEVYGYANVYGTHGFITLCNPSLTSKNITLKLDETLALKAEFKEEEILLKQIYSRNRKLIFDTPEIFNYGDEIEINLYPSEVAVLEVADNLAQLVATRYGMQGIVPQTSEKVDINVELRDSGDGLREGSSQLAIPEDATNKILAITVNLIHEGKPMRRIRTPQNSIKLEAKIDDKIINFINTPDQLIWSSCSWVAFRYKIGRADIGKTMNLTLKTDIPKEAAELIVRGYLLK